MKPALFFVALTILSAQPPAGFSQKYSFRSFLGQTLSSAPDLNGLTIYASNFAQEAPDTPVFPSDVAGLKLVCCNLENVELPAGVTVDDRSGTCGIRRRVRVQNDGRDWIVDASNRPTKLVLEKVEAAQGRSIDPADIPTAGAVAALRAQCHAELSLRLIREKRAVATQNETERCDKALFAPEDMTATKIQERTSRGRH